eukprot:12456169-Alexandrium_andersonii.AAC.1
MSCESFPATAQESQATRAACRDAPQGEHASAREHVRRAQDPAIRPRLLGHRAAPVSYTHLTLPTICSV